MAGTGNGTLAPLRRAALLALVLAGAGCGRRGEPADADADQPVALAPENLARVEVRTLAAGPGISGTLRAKREATLRAEVAGAVIEVAIDAGERVTRGQLLARVDDSSLRQQLSSARSGRAAAANALEVAEANAQRARTLAEAGALAAQQAEQAASALEAARAQLAEAETRATLAAEQVGKARARAPFAGVVAARHVSAGDVVAIGAPLLTVIDPQRLQLEASVPAARLGEAARGASVEFSVTGFGERRFEGRIERIAPSVDPATGQVRVYVDVPNETGRLISGLYAQGRIVARAESGPAVPADAVELSSDPPTVLRVSGGTLEKVPVEIGIRDEVAGAIAITSGVKPGDVLVLGSARGTLTEGAAVTLQAGGRRERTDASRQDEGAPREETPTARRPAEAP